MGVAGSRAVGSEVGSEPDQVTTVFAPAAPPTSGVDPLLDQLNKLEHVRDRALEGGWEECIQGTSGYWAIGSLHIRLGSFQWCPSCMRH